MAIIFISPKKKQQAFFWGASILFLACLAVAGGGFLAWQLFGQQHGVSVNMVFQRPDIVINMSILDSDSVKNLQPFVVVQIQFAYVVEDQSGKQIIGNILADSQDNAKNILEDAGYKVLNVMLADAGKNNPFASY